MQQVDISFWGLFFYYVVKNKELAKEYYELEREMGVWKEENNGMIKRHELVASI